MKLAFCLFKYFPYGGLARDFIRIARECHARGHEIHVYTMSWQGEIEPEFHLHLIDVNQKQNHTRIRAFAEKVKPLLDAGHYDLVIGFNKMPHLDVYYTADICYLARENARKRFFYRLLPRYRTLTQFERAVFAPDNKTEIMVISRIQEHEYLKCYQTEEERIHFLNPGIARDRIAPNNAADIRAKTRRENHITDNQILLLHVGSGFKAKGLDRTIRALAALPEELKSRTQLFVLGQDNAATFEKLAHKLKVQDRVHFLGGRPDVSQLMLAADFLLHPAYDENTGTVLIEAIIAGLPVLTTDVCGYAHYVTDANAGVVLESPFQQEKLNAALASMILSPERKAWNKNGVAFAQHADVYSMPQRASDLIERFGNSNVSPS